jgi:hypothetical protein
MLLRRATQSALLALAPVLANAQAAATDGSLTDGPYIAWLGDTAVSVRAICAGTVKETTLQVAKGKPAQVINPCASTDIITVSAAGQPAVPAVVTKAKKVLALSDVEGDYDILVAFLQKNGVIDAATHWTWGNGHVVLVGDMVDRGTKVTEVLWLIHRLEREAAKAGGGIHYVLGNHDTMLLYGDHRYVDAKYTQAAAQLGVSLHDLFGPTTELGRWMRSKPALVRIDSVLYVHGGIAPSFAERKLGLSRVNEISKMVLNKPELRKSDSLGTLVFGSDGPFWYRGYFKAAPSATELRPALATYGATKIVVGHTIVDAITSLIDGHVIGIDATFKTPEKAQALLVEQGKYYRVDGSGSKSAL